MKLSIKIFNISTLNLMKIIVICYLFTIVKSQTIQSVTANGGFQSACWQQDGKQLGVVSFHVSTDDHLPMEESGLPTLAFCPNINNRAIKLTCDAGWNHDTVAPITVNGQDCWTVTLRDDQPEIGAQCSVSWVDNGTDKLDCQAIAFTGQATVQSSSVSFSINNQQSTGGAGATATGLPKQVLAPQSQQTQTPANTQSQVTVTGGVRAACWGGQNQLTGEVGLDVKINGDGPAKENGLPKLTICGSFSGNPINLDCNGGWNFDNLPSSNVNGGKCMNWQTKDDQGNVGCLVQFSSTGAGNTTIDCTQVQLSVTSQLNGVDAATTFTGKDGNKVAAPPAQLSPAPVQPPAAPVQPSGTAAMGWAPPVDVSVVNPGGPNKQANVADPNAATTTTTTAFASLVTTAPAQSNAAVSITLPLQPVDKCNPVDGTKSSKRVGFLAVTIASSQTDNKPHQPMDDSPEGLPVMTCSFSVPMVGIAGGLSAVVNTSVANGQFTYSMIDDGPNQVWFGVFDTPCKNGQEETPITITSCTCNSKAGACSATIQPNK